MLFRIDDNRAGCLTGRIDDLITLVNGIKRMIGNLGDQTTIMVCQLRVWHSPQVAPSQYESDQ